MSDDEEIAALIADIRAAGWPEGLAAERAAMEAEATPVAADIDVRTLSLAGRPAEALTLRASTPRGAALYLHGGGYVYGSLGSHRGLLGELARATGRTIFQLDYRLAPEHPFPAAFDDAVGAFMALQASAREGAGLVLMGDSAGGGLALATLLALRDAGAPLPRAVVCLSPWTDLTCSGDSYLQRADLDPMVDRSLASRLAALYAGPASLTDTRLSPLFGDLSRLPPILVQVGERETLHADAARFVARARAAGSPATLEEWPGMIHVWHLYHARLAMARRAIARIGAFLDNELGH